MLEGWLVGFGIEYQDSGAPAKLDLLSKATSAAAKQFDALTLSAKAAQDSIFGFGDVARASATSIGALDAALRASAGSADMAAAGSRAAAEGYAATGSAADMAALSIGKYDLATSRANRSGGGGHGVGGYVGGAGAGAILGGPAGAVAGLAVHAAKIGAEIGAGYAIDALYEAGHYATTLQAIANVTGAKPWQMDQIRNLTFDQASKTAMSPIESAKMFLDVARQTPSLSIAQKEMLMPYLSKSSVVLGATRGMSPEQVSEAMVSMVHLFQLYKPEQMQKGFDLFTRSGEMMGVSLNRALTQYSYFVPLAQSLGVDRNQDVVVMAELANMGMGKQRGGTGVQRFIEAGIGLRPGDKMTKHTSALHELGILDAHGQSNFYKNGHLDMLGMLNQLSGDRTRMGGKLYGQTVMDAYLQNAGKVVLAMTTAVQNEQRRATVGRLNQPSMGLDAQYVSLMKQFDPTVKQATKNFQSLATEVGSLMLPAATQGFRELGNVLHDGQVWLHQNKDAEKAFMGGLMVDINLVSREIKAHEKDFQVIGHDIAVLGSGVQVLGRAATMAIGPLAAGARILGDLFTNWGDLPAALGGDKHAAANYHKRMATGAPLPLAGQHGSTSHSSKAPADPGNAAYLSSLRRERTREVHHVHEHTLKLEGGHPIAKAVVEKTIHDVLTSGGFDPQHARGKSGSIHTSANQPTRQSTP